MWVTALLILLVVGLVALVILPFLAWPLFQPFQREHAIVAFIPDAQTTVTVYSRRSHPLPEYKRRMEVQSVGKEVRKMHLSPDPVGWNVIELSGKPDEGEYQFSLRYINTRNRETPIGGLNRTTGPSGEALTFMVPLATPTTATVASEEPHKLGQFDTRQMRWEPVSQ